jgi:thiosulfate/3-mercaptopyruvate sulfurtransferase
MVDGGRKKWFIEDRDLTKATPEYQPATRQVLDPIEEIRAYLPQVREAVEKRNQILVDVRSPREFTGEVTAPPEYPDEHAQRGGHIPGAVNIPWWQATNEDGSFKSTEVLRNLYGSFGVKSNRDVITYCRIGERSSHTWFVLKHLLGYANVRNYDGSWAEWGNMIRNQIQKP